MEADVYASIKSYHGLLNHAISRLRDEGKATLGKSSKLLIERFSDYGHGM